MTHHTLRGLLRLLAEARVLKANADDYIKQERAAFDATFAADLATQKELAERVASLEAEVRTHALHAFNISDDKKPETGVEIVISSKLSYEDAAALAWAKETGMALVPEQLDKKGFEKIAKATVLPFVTYQHEPVVRIATLLNGAAYTEILDA